MVKMLHRGLISSEAEIIALIAAFSQPLEESEASEEVADDHATLDLARELHSRLGEELVSKLIASRWPDLRTRLRKVIAQSNLTAN